MHITETSSYLHKTPAGWHDKKAGWASRTRGGPRAPLWAALHQPPQQMELCAPLPKSVKLSPDSQAGLSQPAGTRKCIHPRFNTKYGSEQDQKCQHLLHIQVGRILVFFLFQKLWEEKSLGVAPRCVFSAFVRFEAAAAKGAATVSLSVTVMTRP